MKEFIKKIKSSLEHGRIFTHSKFGITNRGQSFVEFAVLLPLLLLLMLGIVEYGFMLNTYLSLSDATRQAARKYSNEQPFTDDPLNPDKLSFYSEAATMVQNTLNSNSYKIRYDNSVGSPDNILISVITVDVDTAPDPDTYVITRHPSGYQYFSLNLVNGQPSKYSDTDIKTLMAKGGTPIDAGLLIVEIYYGYEGIFKIGNWFNMAFLPNDANPVILHTATIMPLSAAKP